MRIKNFVNRIRVLNKPKIFCIGLNKTGTTTLNKALQDLGVVVARESAAKPLFDDWVKRDFTNIVKFCKNAQAFQDSPFSFPYTYIILNQYFPDSKFVLTVRDDDEQWYKSITSFHSKLWGGGDGVPPSKDELLNAINSTKGRPWYVNRQLFNTPEDEPYQKESLLKFYNEYNDSVKEYFKNIPDKLLVINVSESDSYKKLLDFLDMKSDRDSFPWENKT